MFLWFFSHNNFAQEQSSLRQTIAWTNYAFPENWRSLVHLTNKLFSVFDRKSWPFIGEGSRFWTRSIKLHIYCLSWIKTKFYVLSADFFWAGSNFMDLRRTLLTFRNMAVIVLILIIVNGLPFHHAPLSNKYRDWINKVQRISSVEDFDIPIIHSYQLHVFCYLLKIIECEIKWFEKFMCFFRSRNIVNDKQAVCIKKKKPN